MKNDGITINKISDLYKMTKIDWTKYYVQIDGFLEEPKANFNIMPKDYLMFAKKSIMNRDLKSCIDAMSNAKRAIDCQIDLLINNLGYNYKIFDNRNSYPEVKVFINDNYQEEQYDGLTDRLKLLNILGLAPTLILSNIRKMRNQMEHEYIELPYSDIKSSIEIAELFINSSDKKFSDSPNQLDIGNKTKEKRNLFEYENIEKPFIEIIFQNDNTDKTIKLLNIETDKSGASITLKPEDKFYIEIVYCLISRDYSKVPFIFEYDIKPEFINYSEV